MSILYDSKVPHRPKTLEVAINYSRGIDNGLIGLSLALENNPLVTEENVEVWANYLKEKLPGLINKKAMESVAFRQVEEKVNSRYKEEQHSKELEKVAKHRNELRKIPKFGYIPTGLTVDYTDWYDYYITSAIEWTPNDSDDFLYQVRTLEKMMTKNIDKCLEAHRPDAAYAQASLLCKHFPSWKTRKELGTYFNQYKPRLRKLVKTSYKVWKMYLDEVSKAGQRAISDIKFRDKPQCWKRFNFTLSYNESEKSYTMSSYNGDNHFMRAFLSDMILRPSCYNCQAKCGKSKSDITIADYWGIDQVHPQMDDDKGTSLLIVRTDKGQQALDFTQMAYTASTYDDAFRFNPAIKKSAVTHPKRTEFFKKLDTTKDLIKLINKELKPSLKQRARIFYHRCRHKAKVLALHLFFGGGNQERENATTVRNTGVVPMCDKEMAIKTISFRNKGNGWKKYRMVLKIKS